MIDINKLKPGDIIKSEHSDRLWTVEKITEEGNICCSRETKARVHFTFMPFEYNELNLVEENDVRNNCD